jgi:hypothetical protein
MSGAHLTLKECRKDPVCGRIAGRLVILMPDLVGKKELRYPKFTDNRQGACF